MIKISIDFYVLVIGAVIGFITGAHKEKGYIRFLPFFALLILCTELTGQLLQGVMNNVFVYNFFSIISFTYYVYFFYESIPDKKLKKIIGHLVWIVPLLFLINILFIQGINSFHTYTFTFGCVLLILLGVIYFYHLFKNKDEVVLLREPSFWICIAVIFHHICLLSIAAVFNYIGELPWSIRVHIKTILKLVAAFTYLFFIIAFLCRRNNTRKSLSKS